MRYCSSNYGNANKPLKGEPNCANGWLSNILWLTWADGKGDAHDIAVCARISSIYADAPLFTISMFWLDPSRFKLIFGTPLDFSTDALAHLTSKTI